MKPEIKAGIVAFFVALVTSYGVTALQEHPIPAEPVKKVALEAACQVLVESGLASVCGLR